MTRQTPLQIYLNGVKATLELARTHLPRAEYEVLLDIVRRQIEHEQSSDTEAA